MKLFGGPGKPEASLGEPGFRKTLKMTHLPPLLGIFASLIKTSKNLLYCATPGVKQLNSDSNNQTISK